MSTLQISCTDKARRPTLFRLYLPAAIAALALLAVISVCVGATPLPPREIWAFFRGTAEAGAANKIAHVRLPRTGAAMLAGAGLALAGQILQQVLHNPLCSPNIIGVNAGAGLFVVLAGVFLPFTTAIFSPFVAFSGALFAVLMVYAIARKTNASQKTIVLAGIAVNSLVGALTDAVTTLNPDYKILRADFAIGSFQRVSGASITAVLPYFCIAAALLAFFRYDLQVIALGDEEASALGMNVRAMRVVFLGCAALFAGLAVSLGGLIGFVGLIIPHITRMLGGRHQKGLYLFTALAGSILCLLCDILARSLFAPYEIPVGIVLSALGAPFFLYLLLRKGRRAAP